MAKMKHPNCKLAFRTDGSIMGLDFYDHYRHEYSIWITSVIWRRRVGRPPAIETRTGPRTGKVYTFRAGPSGGKREIKASDLDGDSLAAIEAFILLTSMQ